MDVHVEDLVFARGGRTILEIPRLHIRAGCVTAVFGVNGAGKSTLLRLVAGLERPTRGQVRVGGVPVASGGAAPRQVSYAFQEAVFLRATMRKNLLLGLDLRGVPPAERTERALQAARECGVSHLLDRLPRTLSGGERQRFNLARALCLQAPTTLLDEPLAGIDGQARERLLDELPGILRTFARTVVLVTHDRYEAFRLADDVVILADGKVRAAGEKGSVFRQPPDRDTALLLGYTLLPFEGSEAAVPPRGLRLGQGRHLFNLDVEQIADLGSHLEVLGRVGGERVAVPVSAGEALPAPGQRVTMSAESIVRFQMAGKVPHTEEPREDAQAVAQEG